jgi:hypothetical protein
MKLFSSLIAVVTAFIIFVSPDMIHAKNSTPTTPPANNSFNNSGRDKHSDELYKSYQQRRMGTQTQGKATKAASSTNLKPASTIRYSPIRKITFRSSPVTAPKGAAATSSKGAGKSSTMPSSSSLGGR